MPAEGLARESNLIEALSINGQSGAVVRVKDAFKSGTGSTVTWALTLPMPPAKITRLNQYG